VSSDAAGRGARWLAVVAQLALVLWVAHVYRIEELRQFDRLIPVIFVGFLIHSVIPKKVRLPTFVVLSWVGTGAVLGAVPAMWLVTAGLVLIAVCHLPLSFGARIVVLLAAGAGLAAARAGQIDLPDDAAVMLPILGSMFMIRMIIYCYDLRHGQEPKGWSRLAYFFLLPNVCFPLFPAVDSRTFIRTWYDDASFRIYQKGLAWIARGLFQIVLYRLVYMHVLPAPTGVASFSDLLLFTVGSYFLYIRISGLFHLIIGILCLFGFNLPETHRRYFFASSFTDFWHRINIYWTAFMTKIVYYPVMMRFRKRGPARATALAVAAVFTATTLLHAYQWFWLRGSFLVTSGDALFFGVLGALVLLAALREAQAGPRRRPSAEPHTFRERQVRSWRTVGVFCVISVLWAMWNTPSVSAWWNVTASNAGGGREWAMLAAALVAVAFVGGLLTRRASPAGVARRAGRPVYVIGLSAVLLLASTPNVQKRFGPSVGSILATIDDDRFSQWDEDQVIHGYYEGLLQMNRLNSRIWEMQLSRPAGKTPFRETDAVFRTGGVPGYELIPSNETPFRDTIIRTNAWGMRDLEYEQPKRDGTFRIALLGSSYVMGWGVDNDEGFEAILESRLDMEPPRDEFERYEVLNFAVGGYTLADHVALCEERVFEFEPDVVIYVSHTGMMSRELERLADYLAEGTAARSTVLQDLLGEIAVDPSQSAEEIRRQLRGERRALNRWGYGKIVDACLRHDAVPLNVFLPKIRQIEMTRLDRELIELAEETCFQTIILEDVYGDWDSAAIRVAPWDFHPNALGHRLIADNLFDHLVDYPGLLRPIP
jgi:D-alanyl-lipoteichoic acid acyltransferase DltB (MBOAT superfamily)